MKVEQTGRRYIISEKELKQKLGIVGDIQQIALWKGRSPSMIEKKTVSQEDHDQWYIDTIVTEPEGKA